MIKSILVPLLGDESDDRTLEYALTVANQFHAHIDALHVSHNPVDEVLRLVIGDGVITGELWNAIEREIGERHKKARSSFDRFCTQRTVQIQEAPKLMPGVTAGWSLVEGDLATEVSLKGRFRELIVVDRGSDKSGFTPSEMGNILIRSGRPMLISSRGKSAPKTFETVAVAWKDTVEATRMMMTAMPFLEAASRVIVLAASENEDNSAEIECAENLAVQLRWHGIEPEIQCLCLGRDAVGEALVEAATSAGADLLALGGYGHSRAREYVFGGVTRHMLEFAQFPVLMVH